MRRLLPALLLTAALVGLGRCEDLDDDDERSPSSGPRSVGHAPFLITGSGRSWLSKTAAKLERFAVPVGKQRILSEGGVVSWPYAHYRDRGLPVELESNSQDSRALRLAPGFRFSPVLHQVRHPLGEIRVRASPFPTLFCARVTHVLTHTHRVSPPDSAPQDLMICLCPYEIHTEDDRSQVRWSHHDGFGMVCLTNRHQDINTISWRYV